MKMDSTFVGLIYCHVCKKETRHYAKRQSFRKYRRIFCEICRTLKMQLVDDDVLVPK